MDRIRDTDALCSAIRNAGWMVRHYRRGSRLSAESQPALRRRDAIHQLGLTVRHAFNASSDFEPLLTAVLDALDPRELPPRF